MEKYVYKYMVRNTNTVIENYCSPDPVRLMRSMSIVNRSTTDYAQVSYQKITLQKNLYKEVKDN